MRIINYCIALTMWVLASAYGFAQETDITAKVGLLESSKEEVISEEKEALKVEVENINKRLDSGNISQSEAEELKKKAAEKRALNIENRVAIIDNKVALLKRNEDEDIERDSDVIIRFGGEEDNATIYIGKKNKQRKYDRRTTWNIVFAVGLNNVITEGQSLNDSDFKIGGSRFAEYGLAWKTRVFKNSNWLRIKYGVSFHINGLKPTDNRYYVVNGSQTELQTYPISLNKSKFRMDNLVFPVHFEFGPSNKTEHEDYIRYSTRNKFKFGVGGYAGFLLSARQKLKYSENGEDAKLKLTGDYNTNNIVYGVSAYMGWRCTALYVKYDLNTIFKNNTLKQRNVSLGLRFDMN